MNTLSVAKNEFDLFRVFFCLLRCCQSSRVKNLPDGAKKKEAVCGPQFTTHLYANNTSIDAAAVVVVVVLVLDFVLAEELLLKLDFQLETNLCITAYLPTYLLGANFA